MKKSISDNRSLPAEQLPKTLPIAPPPTGDDKEKMLPDAAPATEAGVPAELPPQRLVLKECAVAGWQMRHLGDKWGELYEGAPLTLVRDAANSHDSHAVAVMLSGDDKRRTDNLKFLIGYVPRADNTQLARMMDMGWGDAFTAELSTVNNSGKAADRLRMTIYVTSNQALQPTTVEASFFALCLDDDKYADVSRQLYRRGFVLCHWGAHTPDASRLPREGDLLVIFNCCLDQTELMLLRVTAVGAATTAFIEADEGHGPAGTSPYVLTLVRGPISVRLKLLDYVPHNIVMAQEPNTPLVYGQIHNILAILSDTCFFPLPHPSEA